MGNIQKQEERNRYRSSFGATLLFSSVQVFQILIKIVKSKFVALFIGPAGMGIQSLLSSTVETISAATNLGLNTSSVKTIAAANRENNRIEIARNVKALRRLIWLTGLLGTLFCAVLAPIWSQTSFGDSTYVMAFVVVSVVVLLEQLNRGELALLQGMQQKKKLARANVIGQSLNAAITIPLYYFFGVNAIVAAFIIGAAISLTITSYYSHQIKIEKIQMSFRETFMVGREMIKLGFFLSLQFLLQNVVLWIVRNYVSNVGSVDDVGLYSAGTSIVVSYVGLVFAAIATDYFPRLAATKNNDEMRVAVHTQAELTILMLAPLVVAFIVFCKPVVVLLYSSKFLPIEHMMYCSIGAVLLQAMGWALAYTLLAKAKPSYYFLNELVTTAWSLPVRLICYKYWGLTGFGISSIITYAIYLLQVLMVSKKLFGISYDFSIWRLFLILNIPVVCTVVLKLTLTEMWGYFGGILLLMLVMGFCLYRLNQKMDLKSYVNQKIRRK